MILLSCPLLVFAIETYFVLCDVRAKAEETVFVNEPDFLRFDLRAEAEETIDHTALIMIDFKDRLNLVDYYMLMIIDLFAKGFLMMIDCKSVAQRRRYMYRTLCVKLCFVFLKNSHRFNI